MRKIQYFFLVSLHFVSRLNTPSLPFPSLLLCGSLSLSCHPFPCSTFDWLLLLYSRYKLHDISTRKQRKKAQVCWEHGTTYWEWCVCVCVCKFLVGMVPHITQNIHTIHILFVHMFMVYSVFAGFFRFILSNIHTNIHKLSLPLFSHLSNTNLLLNGFIPCAWDWNMDKKC